MGRKSIQIMPQDHVRRQLDYNPAGFIKHFAAKALGQRNIIPLVTLLNELARNIPKAQRNGLNLELRKLLNGLSVEEAYSLGLSENIDPAVLNWLTDRSLGLHNDSTLYHLAQARLAISGEASFNHSNICSVIDMLLLRKDYRLAATLAEVITRTNNLRPADSRRIRGAMAKVVAAAEEHLQIDTHQMAEAVLQRLSNSQPASGNGIIGLKPSEPGDYPEAALPLLWYIDATVGATAMRETVPVEERAGRSNEEIDLSILRVNPARVVRCLGLERFFVLIAMIEPAEVDGLLNNEDLIWAFFYEANELARAVAIPASEPHSADTPGEESTAGLELNRDMHEKVKAFQNRLVVSQPQLVLKIQGEESFRRYFLELAETDRRECALLFLSTTQGNPEARLTLLLWLGDHLTEAELSQAKSNYFFSLEAVTTDTGVRQRAASQLRDAADLPTALDQLANHPQSRLAMERALYQLNAAAAFPVAAARRLTLITPQLSAEQAAAARSCLSTEVLAKLAEIFLTEGDAEEDLQTANNLSIAAERLGSVTAKIRQYQLKIISADLAVFKEMAGQPRRWLLLVNNLQRLADELDYDCYLLVEQKIAPALIRAILTSQEQVSLPPQSSEVIQEIIFSFQGRCFDLALLPKVKDVIDRLVAAVSKKPRLSDAPLKGPITVFFAPLYLRIIYVYSIDHPQSAEVARIIPPLSDQGILCQTCQQLADAGQAEAAIRLGAKLADSLANNPAYLAGQGDAHLVAGNYQRAGEYLSTAFGRTKKVEHGLKAVTALSAAGDHDQVIIIGEQLPKRLSPKFREEKPAMVSFLYASLGKAYRAKEDRTKATAAYERALQAHPTNVPVLAEAIKFYLSPEAGNNPERAYQLAANLRTYAPEDFGSYTLLASCLGNLQRDRAEVIASLERAAALIDRNKNAAPINRAKLFLQLADLYKEAGRHDQAASSGRRAMQYLLSKSLAQQVFLAMVTMRDFRAASNWATKIVRPIYPETSIEENLLLIECLSETGRIADAEQRCHNHLAIEPANCDILFQLGYAYFKAERYSEALATFEHVCSIDPENLRAQLNIVACHINLNNYQAAIELGIALKQRIPAAQVDMHTNLDNSLLNAYRKSGQMAAADAFIAEIKKADPVKAVLLDSTLTDGNPRQTLSAIIAALELFIRDQHQWQQLFAHLHKYQATAGVLADYQGWFASLKDRDCLVAAYLGAKEADCLELLWLAFPISQKNNLCRLVDSLLAEERPEEASVVFTSAAAQFGADRDIALMRQKLLYQAGQYQEAITAASVLVTQVGTDTLKATAQLLLAQSFEAAGDQAAATQKYKEAIKSEKLTPEQNLQARFALFNLLVGDSHDPMHLGQALRIVRPGLRRAPGTPEVFDRLVGLMETSSIETAAEISVLIQGNLHFSPGGLLALLTILAQRRGMHADNQTINRLDESVRGQYCLDVIATPSSASPSA